MQLCPRCQITYPPSVKVCPRDGEQTTPMHTPLPIDLHDDPVLGKYAGSYRLHRKIGSGGMGGVYEGIHPTLGKRVAVKVLHPEFAHKATVVERFFAEARAVSQLGHENIVDVQDFGTIEGNLPYILMELLEGYSLKDLLRREGSLAPETAIHIVSQLLEALDAAHKKGIIHRDLKPDNIFLVSRHNVENFVKLLDFGIAKLLEEANKDSEAKNLTQAGTVVGTPQYMSPEQAHGHIDKISARSDIYSVGVILFELLCGRLPFPETSFGDLVIAHVMKTPPTPRSINPGISRPLEQIVLKALKKEQKERFASTLEMRDALRAAPLVSSGRFQAFEGQGQETGQETPTDGEMVVAGLEASPRRMERLVLLGAASLGGLLLVGALILEFLIPVQKDKPPVGFAARDLPASVEVPAPQVFVPIQVISVPANAELSIRLDGAEAKSYGRTPTEVKLPKGVKAEFLFKKDKDTWSKELVVDVQQELHADYVAPVATPPVNTTPIKTPIKRPTGGDELPPNPFQ